jgi:exonuclease III
MMETKKLAQIDKERNAYHIEILGLGETRWNGSGEHRIPQGGILLYSGKPINDKHESDMGILLSPKAHKSLIEWKPISDRIIMARFLTKLCKLVVIQCYAPTEQAITEEKDAFYETLENTLRNVKRA